MRTIRFRHILKAMACAVILSLTACGGGGGGGGGGLSASDFDGTWFGNIEDTGSNMGTITVEISGGQITSVLRNGIDQGITGTLSREQGNIWSIEFSDGTFAGFITDGAAEHAAFLSENFEIGAVEKDGAVVLPIYSNADIARSATGTVLTVDSNFEIVDVGTSNVDCDSSGTCNGSDSLFGAFAVTGVAHNTGGRFIDDTATSFVFLTPDKEFAAGYSCEFGFFLEDCTFYGWDVN